MFRQLTRTIARLCFIAAVCLCIVTGLLIAQRNWPNRFPELAPAAQAKLDVVGATTTDFPTPIYIEIAARNIALPVIPATKTGDTWDVSSKNVSAIAPSSPEHGWILYGHNWPSLLGPLQRAEVGESVTIVFANDQQKQYVIDGISQVNPNQDTVLHQVPADHALLYTCTGFFDRERLIVSLAEVAKVR